MVIRLSMLLCVTVAAALHGAAIHEPSVGPMPLFQLARKAVIANPGVAVHTLDAPYVFSYEAKVALGQEAVRKALEQKVTKLSGHSDSVVSLAYSFDGKYFATGSYDNTVCIWDAATYTPIQKIEDCASIDAADAIGFNPLNSGQLAVPRLEKGMIGVFDIHTAQLLHQFKADNLFDVLAIAYSPNGKLLASIAKQNNGIHIFSTTDLALISVVGCDCGSGYALLFLDDARFVVGAPFGACIVDIETQRIMQRIDIGSVDLLAFNSVTNKLACTNLLGRTTFFIDLPTGEIDQKIFVAGFFAFSPDGIHIAYDGCGNRCIEQVTTKKNISLKDVVGSYEIAALKFSADSKVLAIGTFAGAVKIVKGLDVAFKTEEIKKQLPVEKLVDVPTLKLLLLGLQGLHDGTPLPVSADDPAYCALIKCCPALVDTAIFALQEQDAC